MGTIAVYSRLHLMINDAHVAEIALERIHCGLGLLILGVLVSIVNEIIFRRDGYICLSMQQ